MIPVELPIKPICTESIEPSLYTKHIFEFQSISFGCSLQVSRVSNSFSLILLFVY